MKVRRPKVETRKRLLDVAVGLVRAQDLGGRLDVLVTQVLDEVDMTTGAAYQTWQAEELRK